MLFNSLDFLFFFIVVYAAYVVANHGWQNRLLLVASYVFYGAWDYRFLSLLFFTTAIDYVVGNLIARQSQPKKRKSILLISICVNLGVLGVFKYFNFFADSLAALFLQFGMEISPFTLRIILPVGISFYTFQSMAYTIDIYRGRLEPCKTLSDFALYVAFFPQLVAGPIERATTLVPQIMSKRVVTIEKIGHGVTLIVLGLFKKVVVADNLAVTVNQIFSKQADFSAQEVVTGVLFFAFQIYGDFSGYTDIARGISRLLGFELMLNFRQPYFARNPSDFWNRWHISLSTWLRDYLYIPLGGNRGSSLLTYRNLFLTMLLGGLWHGAAWNFVFWGMYHGLLLIGYRFVSERLSPDSASSVFGRRAIGQGGVAVGVMFVFTLYGWLLFRAGSGQQIVEMTLGLFNYSGQSILLVNLVKLAIFVWPIVIIDYFQFRRGEDEPAFILASMPVQVVAYAYMLLMFVVMGQYEGTSFIYFQF